MLDGINRFTYNPTSVSIQRSKMDRSFGHKTTFDAGKLIPIYLEEVLPGDTVQLSTAAVCRMTTPIYPVMDNAFIDIYYFYAPMRLGWDHTKEFFGENTSGPWEQTTEYTIPQVRVDLAGEHSMADYFGLPTFDQPGYFYFTNALPFRLYALIWNEYFRDQNTMTPIPISKGDATQSISSSVTLDWYQANGPMVIRPETMFFGINCRPLPVCKFHDMFTSCLPEPQKGPAVTLPIADAAPLTLGDRYSIGDSNNGIDFSSSVLYQNDRFYPMYSTAYNDLGRIVVDSATSASQPTLPTAINQTNLYADLSDAAMVTINAFRQAMALQGLYELDARGGTRYREIIKSHFGVTSPDARMQVPEFLHGKRVPITMAQVLQTSSTDETSPQGNTAAYSLTQDAGESFTYSATEHGYIIGLACVRTSTSYQNRIERLWSRKRRFDFYWPVFANLGEQPVYEKELYFDPTSSGSNNGTPYDPDVAGNLGERVFGFQEAWYDYRYKPSMITGKFRSNATGSLDVWHYSQDFETSPTLSPAFMVQPGEVVSRTLAVQDEPQFIADFYFKQTWVRPMPMYSIPAFLGKL